MKKELEEDTRTHSILIELEASNYEDPSTQTLEVIAETLEEKIETNPDFAREVQEVQNIFEKELESNSSPDVQEYVREVKRLANKIKHLQKDVDDVKKEIKINVDRGDYLGQYRAILSGNNNIIQGTSGVFSINIKQGKVGGMISRDISRKNRVESQYYTECILAKIEQIKGKTTQFLTVKESMDELDKIRQPRSISIDYIQQELGVRFSLFFLGDAFFRRLTKKRKKMTLIKMRN
ncbi:MAG: hypothetical protein F6K40_20940 [Okeania sp. SIO3I5]|uniref:hypothetical protein n=1 Tax=Okeania sp. SIO3I5 TaxID=2607805 RepID=UPI0013B70017|nr:hypothetical protein [Okeania sp. SIO3I5]NEQ38598.1 hypothetical protein [Okeania sp. SIO3I5]